MGAPLIITDRHIHVIGSPQQVAEKHVANRFEPYRGTSTLYAVFQSHGGLQRIMRHLREEELDFYKGSVTREGEDPRQRPCLLDEESLAKVLRGYRGTLADFLRSLFVGVKPQDITVEVTERLLRRRAVHASRYRPFRSDPSERPGEVVRAKVRYITAHYDGRLPYLEKADDGVEVLLLATEDRAYYVLALGDGRWFVTALEDPKIIEALKGSKGFVSETFYV